MTWARRAGSLVPVGKGQGLVVGPDGNYSGTLEDPENQIVYIVQTDKGQVTLSPQAFRASEKGSG